MRIIITESQIDELIFKFLDLHLRQETSENGKHINFYMGDEVEIVYDISDQLIFVDPHVYGLVYNMFDLTNTKTVKIFKDYLKSKGYKVKWFV